MAKKRTPRSSKTTSIDPSLVEAASFAVGHRPDVALSTEQAALFRAFQSNLLSLISHELRTPMMGILNALGMLEEPELQGDFTAQELISMARRNAQRLHRTLATILDVAAIESGTFHARLREVDLARLAQSRVQAVEPALRDRDLSIQVESNDEEPSSPMVADPQRLGRAIDLCLQRAIARAQASSQLEVKVDPPRVAVTFRLDPASREAWSLEWTQALAGFQGGVATPGSAFAGTLQSEEAFLSRMEEGLGSELLLAHEIMRLQGGELSAETSPDLNVTFSLSLPERSPEEGVRAVLASRASQVSPETGGVSSLVLAVIQIPTDQKPDEFRTQVKKNLFRSSDAVYALPSQGVVALIMDDCKPEDAPRLLARIEKSVQREAEDPALKLLYGIAACPLDGADPASLVELASNRLRERG